MKNKTHADYLKEALTIIVSAKPKPIMDFIRSKHPDIEVKENSYRTSLVAYSTNHSSRKHHKGYHRFIFYDKETGCYRLAGK